MHFPEVPCVGHFTGAEGVHAWPFTGERILEGGDIRRPFTGKWIPTGGCMHWPFTGKGILEGGTVRRPFTGEGIPTGGCMRRPCHQSTGQDRPQLLGACLAPGHRTGTPAAPPCAGPHVGGLATSPEGEHYCGGGEGAVPWCQLTGELKLTPARRRSARGRGCGVRGARTIRYRCRRPWPREGVT